MGQRRRQPAAKGKVAGGGGREGPAVGAAGARQNEEGEPCASGHEERSEGMRV